MKESIFTNNAPVAIGPYSQGIKVGDLLFVSGQIPVDPASGVMPEDISEQTRRSLANGEAILKSANLTLSDVVKTTVFITNLDNFSKMNEVYATFFTEPYPARSTVEVSKLPKDALVEIELIASFK